MEGKDDADTDCVRDTTKDSIWVLVNEREEDCDGDMEELPVENLVDETEREATEPVG